MHLTGKRPTLLQGGFNLDVVELALWAYNRWFTRSDQYRLKKGCKLSLKYKAIGIVAHDRKLLSNHFYWN